MRHWLYTGLLLCLAVPHIMFGQTGSISGSVLTDSVAAEHAAVGILNSPLGTHTNAAGQFILRNIPYGTYTLSATYIGFEKLEKTITLNEQNPHFETQFWLNKKVLQLEKLVITGTKTFQHQTKSPVMVNVLDHKTLNNVQACNLSEGLKFQAGMRVETDCQTCNYTQLRMNGLAGGYSQILINGRPIFSPLTGLYGLEQIPTNMIDRIEIVRGGGSSLYGSSAIGGTVNVLTKIPKTNSYSLGYSFQSINANAQEHQLTGNATAIAAKKNSGISIFVNRRIREAYDHNGDNFSELPKLNNQAIGTTFFLLPKNNQKLEVSLSYLKEYRYGGEMISNVPAHRVQQAEERTHHVLMGSADYQINFKNDKTSLISYFAWQHTKREHYTGILPDEADEFLQHVANPPYGNAQVSTYNAGIQLNHRANFISGTKNAFTLGAEYLQDDVLDVIPAYQYRVDQRTEDVAFFAQSDWALLPQLSLLSGVRMDRHNLVSNPIFSPRVALLYKIKQTTQLRLSYGAGFRAPQAFDSDMHIAFAGGGVSRVLLSPILGTETSKSLSASINYDQTSEKFIVGFTLEGFYNRLQRAFILQPIGQDQFGELFEKQNGQGATVFGGILEVRANYNRQLQLEAGFTLQNSLFDEEIEYIDGVPSLRHFMRTPNDYGFANLTITPNESFSFNLNYVYTGSMFVPHFAGASNQLRDEIFRSPAFSELSAKMGYTLNIKSFPPSMEIYGGVKNMLNAYQRAFDVGKYRDSNFIYGPAAPRTVYLGLRLLKN